MSENIICPLMSCRVTRAEEGSKTLTPTIVRCQPECAWYDRVNSQCVVRSMLGEMIKIGGE